MDKKDLIRELARMEVHEPTKTIHTPDEAYGIFAKYANKKQELFIVASLNSAHEVMKVRVISKGLVNKTLVHPREVFSDPIKERATAIFICHNHPSGNSRPSPEDCNLTNRLMLSSNILGIPIMDHLIVSKNGFYSFLQDDKLF